jgi:hypothetical protein
MPIGGVRPGAGRKSQWQGKTKMMRLPAEHEQQLISYAHRLEAGESEMISRDDLTVAIASVLLTIPPHDRRKVKRLFDRVIQKINDRPAAERSQP